MHMKGYILRLLADRGQMWDYEILDAVSAEYGVAGAYWTGTVRLTLTDLYAGGLLDELDATVDPSRSGGQEKILFKYAVNAFGRTRMAQSGLLGARS